ncbi:phenazine biosynthesis protein [Ramaria rubella]|nr:phenazine biosynthesis protein [Ramaria rubella]
MINYSVVDAFTSLAFKGNGAAVIILDPNCPLPDAILQLIAAEFNLSETAFVTPINPELGRFGLRWFTPKLEVALCGHATLAAASVLFSGGSVLPRNIDLIEFETVRSGVLTAKHLLDGRIELEFPSGEVAAADDTLTDKVKRLVHHAFGAAEAPVLNFVGWGEGASYSTYLLIEISADYDLENAPINPASFLELAPQHEVIIVTQRGQGEESFRSRVFAPANGIPEDPVTGSAHSMLGPYWAKLLQKGGNARSEMIGKQVSARSGEVGVSLDRGGMVCKLRGSTTLIAKGELYLPE